MLAAMPARIVASRLGMRGPVEVALAGVGLALQPEHAGHAHVATGRDDAQRVRRLPDRLRGDARAEADRELVDPDAAQLGRR